jgi:cytochrome c biogenesis protein CcmG/thiol:disulfide interchange protein DsbE
MAARAKLVAQAGAVALVAGLLALLVWKLMHQDKNVAAAMSSGKHPAAPNFVLRRLDGHGKLKLSSLRGKAVVINFWASWCDPCKRETPRLERSWRRWQKRGVVFVGVDVLDFSGDARSFLRHYKVSYPVVHDGSGEKVVGPYGLTGYPETFFVDRKGRLVGDHIDGPVQNGELERNIRLALRS